MPDTICRRALLINDDGIDAPGLAVLEAVAAEIADEVWVVAPDGDRSGASHSINLHRDLRSIERGPRRFAVTGTPGDCAVLGIRHVLRDTPPDLCLSGINRGMNLGIETVFSGTVGGAMTAMIFGVPAIALSRQVTRGGEANWDAARALAPAAIRRLVGCGLMPATCLNVNFPDLPAAQVGELTLSRQGPGLIETIDVDTAADGIHRFSFRRSAREQHPQCDAAVLRAGRISVTPIRYDRTDEAAYRALAARLPAIDTGCREE